MGLVELHQVVVTLDGIAVLAEADDKVLMHLFEGQVLVSDLTGLLIDLLLFKGEGGIVGAQFLYQRVLGAVEDTSGFQKLLGNDNLLVDVVDLVLAAQVVRLHSGILPFSCSELFAACSWLLVVLVCCLLPSTL